MKKFYLLLLAVSLLSMGSVSEPLFFSDVGPSIVCPECTKEFENCSNVAHKAYTTAVENAADSINSKSSRFDYRAACAEARKTRDKALADCRAVYHKCCVSKTGIKNTNKEQEEEQ